MNVDNLAPGLYVVAVSGGVDSVVLFDIVRKMPGVEVVLAHFDHGIRDESQQDRKFVQELAMSHNVKFEYGVGELGPHASEARAREARYNFLRQVRENLQAKAIVLGHHKDDVLETAVINLIRGTGRKGLTSLRSHAHVLRPLLGWEKSDIINYATTHNLKWRHDETNDDQSYLRNYIRHSVLRKFTKEQREKLYLIIVRQYSLNKQVDDLVLQLVAQHDSMSPNNPRLLRHWLIMLPACVASEILQHKITRITGASLQRSLAWRALLFCRVATPHKRFILNKYWQLRATKDTVIVERCES